MSLGILFVIGGILIAMFPQLLSIIVASVLVLIGSGICAFSYRLKRMERRQGDPFTDFFTRY